MHAAPAPDAPPAPPTDADASDLPVTYADVAAAAHRLAGVAHRTPVLTSRTLDRRTGARVVVKGEHVQRTGAFKFRGGYNALSLLTPEHQRRGVLTYSSGNHAQAIALAGQLLDIPATIIMPENAPQVKLDATRGYGAEVITYDPEEVTREALGAEIAEERGLPIIPPYDHPHVVAGQGTVADELFDQVKTLDVLLVCCGGGGLLSGCALAARHHAPGCRVVGVEPEAADDATRSFHTGTLHAVHNPDTIADGARTPSLGTVTFPLVRALVDDMVTVSDDALVRAMRFAWGRMKQVIEPTGALALAALLEGTVSGVEGKRVGAVISGGNVDVAWAARLLG
jgi:threonine dehydratase